MALYEIWTSSPQYHQVWLDKVKAKLESKRNKAITLMSRERKSPVMEWFITLEKKRVERSKHLIEIYTQHVKDYEMILHGGPPVTTRVDVKKAPEQKRGEFD